LTAAERRQLDSLERYFDHVLPVIGALRELGLADRMAFGSDAGPFDTEFGHLEYNVHLARLAGLTPMESIQAVTRNAARLLGLEAHVGTVEAGKDADLLVLAADPLADAAGLTRVVAVFRRGVRVR
jgi:imidazolonepropionase-like amidohydrolase